ncbi:hypothetical protein [Methanosarcina barkeri]|uniref:hypothetical protein n=1 Tax=Methanosarcina barkeri TaxID=2208 RepID=UPI00064EF2CE|nr:hypothetical protein [Methanosarcina barkeri]
MPLVEIPFRNLQDWRPEVFLFSKGFFHFSKNLLFSWCIRLAGVQLTGLWDTVKSMLVKEFSSYD